MKIKIKREGGFIGITSKANLDYDELTEEEQNALNSLAEQSLKADNQSKEPSATKDSKSDDVDSVKSKPKTRGLAADESKPEKGLELAGNGMPDNAQNGMMRDAFCYSISMKKDGKTVSMTFDDMTAPPEVVQIFQKYVQY